MSLITLIYSRSSALTHSKRLHPIPLGIATRAEFQASWPVSLFLRDMVPSSQIIFSSGLKTVQIELWTPPGTTLNHLYIGRGSFALACVLRQRCTVHEHYGSSGRLIAGKKSRGPGSLLDFRILPGALVDLHATTFALASSTKKTLAAHWHRSPKEACSATRHPTLKKCTVHNTG